MNFLKRFLLVSALTLSVVSVYAGGIDNAKELVAFVTAVNTGQDISEYMNDKGAVCLEADIDMSKVKKLESIKTFGGTFDGQGFSLKNWKARNGLINELLEGGRVCNLRIDSSCSMKAQSKGGDYFLGWLVNINSGTVENCENHGSLSHKSNYTTGHIFVGGLVGSNRYVVYRCRNYGSISSECVGCTPEIMVRVGGVAAAAYDKHVWACSIARCENFGDISCSTDAKFDRVAGIVADAYKTTVKMCVNHGKISAESVLGADSRPGQTLAGGIVGFTKHDVICSDNFGEIISAGVNNARTAGICSMPHGKLVVADCTNYGKVECANENSSDVGGVAASIGREVHIINGINRGLVRFAGVCPSSPSNVGGVVGNIYAKRKAATCAYLRRCAHYGTVESMSGGNNYQNHPSAIHTGGIVGCSKGSARSKVRILDCISEGTVKAITGRKGNIAGFISQTDVTGEAFDNNYALKAEPLADGSTIYGRVATESGEPISGCVVSDGSQCVVTDNDGCYAMKSDMKDTRFVFISIPSEYKIPVRKSVPQNFRRIYRYTNGAVANFTLERRTEPTDKYTVIMIGDPQMRGLGTDNSGERYRDVILPDIEEYRKTTTGEFFSINLGDLVYNWMAGYDDYMDLCAPLTYPVFQVIGNHDYDQATILEGRLGTPYFEEYICPVYYSFNIGKIHYVVVNSIEYSREDYTKHYGAGLDDRQMKWLEEDLKHVPKENTIFICGHAQLFKNMGEHPDLSHGIGNMNYKRYTELLKQYKRVYSWSGHYHTNFGYDYVNDPQYPDLKQISCISVARCIGQLRSNQELNVDGTTNGYTVVEVDGENLEWWYKTVGKDRSYQMRTYSPLRTGDGYVKVNIWSYSPYNWSAIEWWENGVKVAEFEKSKEFDLQYLDIFNERLSHLTGTAGMYAQPGKSDFMFRVKPSEGVRSGEIKVTDNFGVTYTETVEW